MRGIFLISLSSIVIVGGCEAPSPIELSKNSTVAYDDPCALRPPPSPLAQLFTKSQDDTRAAACARQKAEQKAKQLAEEQANQQREAARQAEIARQQRDAREAAKAAQLKAENSPDNICKDPGVARMVMDSFNNLGIARRFGVEVYDIKHVTTVSSKEDENFACRGDFFISDGSVIRGTLSYSKNITGDTIANWKGY